MSACQSHVLDEATVQDRRARFGAFWPIDARRMSPMPSVLHTEPEFQAFEAERQAIFAAQARLRRQVEEIVQRNELANAIHVDAAKRAMESGGPLPLPPTLELSPIPPELNTFRYWDEKHKAVEAAELALLVERGDHWKRRLKVTDAQESARVARNALADAESHLKPLTAAVEEIDRLVGPIRKAQERSARKDAAREATRDIPWQATRNRQSPGAEDLMTQVGEFYSRPSSPLAGRR